MMYSNINTMINCVKILRHHSIMSKNCVLFVSCCLPLNLFIFAHSSIFLMWHFFPVFKEITNIYLEQISNGFPFTLFVPYNSI